MTRRYDDPYSVWFMPSEIGCKKCGATESLLPSRFCRHTVECFERAIHARKLTAMERLREMFPGREYALEMPRKRPAKRRKNAKTNS